MIDNSFAKCSLDQKIASYGTVNLASKSVMIISAVASIAIPIFKNYIGKSWIATGGLIGLSVVVLLTSALWKRHIDYRLKPYQWTAQVLEKNPNLERIQAAIIGANEFKESNPNIQKAFLTFLNVPRAANELSWEEVVGKHSIDFNADDVIKMLPHHSDESDKKVGEQARKVVQISEKDMTPVLFEITNLSSFVLTNLHVTFSFIDKSNNGSKADTIPTGGSLAFNITSENPLRPNQTVEIRASNIREEYRDSDVRILDLLGMEADEATSKTHFYVYNRNQWSNRMTIIDSKLEYKMDSTGPRLLMAIPT